jgi:hypothetical protein
MQRGTRLTTIVTPAKTLDLTTLDAFKTDLGLEETADDAFLKQQITNESRTAQSNCHRVFAVQIYQDKFFLPRDFHPRVLREAVEPLQLSSMPASPVGPEWSLEVESVVEGQSNPVTLVQGTDFLVDPFKAQLIRVNERGYPRSWRASPVIVVYSAGYSPIPADVAQAANLLVKMRWYARKRDPMVRSRSAVGIYEASYWGGTGIGGADDMTAEATAKLERYRIPVIG